MNDKIEIDRADLQVLVDGGKVDEWQAVRLRMEELLGRRCEFRIPGVDVVARMERSPIRCVLLKGHTAIHQVDPQLWTQP